MKGIRRHGRGWQARASVEGVGRLFQSFPLDTSEEDMQRWRSTAKARLELQRDDDRIAAAGTFPADVKRYLRAVAAMPDIKNRTRDIEEWIPVFRRKRTLAIKPHEIRAQRDRWLLVGPKRIFVKSNQEFEEVAAPLAASTVNHRLRALQNLVTVLYPGQDNPVKHVPEAEEPEAHDRSLSYEEIERVLAKMPDRGPGVRGRRRSKVSKSKARIRLIAYTGITPAQMELLRIPDDFDLETPAIRVSRRKKGKGVKGGWRPVPFEAIPAMQAFIAAKAGGKFSRDSLRQAWQRACANAKVPRSRVYDLRHAFGTAVLAQTGDIQATQRLLNHADPRTTERYAHRAIPGWLRGAAARVRFGSGER